MHYEEREKQREKKIRKYLASRDERDNFSVQQFK